LGKEIRFGRRTEILRHFFPIVFSKKKFDWKFCWFGLSGGADAFRGCLMSARVGKIFFLGAIFISSIITDKRKHYKVSLENTLIVCWAVSAQLNL